MSWIGRVWVLCGFVEGMDLRLPQMIMFLLFHYKLYLFNLIVGSSGLGKINKFVYCDIGIR